MANKFRKAEKNSSGNNSLIVITAISLFILMVSGAAAIMNKETKEPGDNKTQVVEKYEGGTPSVDVNSGQQVEIENKENSSVNNEINENKEDEKPEETPKPAVFNFPCETDIICEYSGNTPVFSEILQDWRTHPAIDYANETQFDVKAISDGIVEDIYTDGLMGVTVLIDHGNELKSVYQSLDENISVKKDDKITAGTVIGKAGNTATTEKYDGKYLLHFAVLDNGEYKDPALYISQ